MGTHKRGSIGTPMRTVKRGKRRRKPMSDADYQAMRVRQHERVLRSEEERRGEHAG